MIDRHGTLSVFEEAGWLNVHTMQQKSKTRNRNTAIKLEIVGLTLNSLLLGLFLLHGGHKETSITLHIEEECWVTVEKGIGVTLFTIASTQEIFNRIDYIIEGFVYNQQLYLAKDDHIKAREGEAAKKKRTTMAMDHLRLLDGALKFMKWWIMRYDKFLDDKQFTDYKSFTLDCSSKLGVVGGSSKDMLISPRVIGKENMAPALSLVMSARMTCRDITKYLSVAMKERFLRGRGMTSSLEADRGGNATNAILCPTVNHIPAAVVAHAPFYEHDLEERKRAATAENLKKASEIEIDFFGGVDALFDDEDEGLHNPEVAEEVIKKPRIPEGKTSYSSPSSFEVWQVDPLELARQATLVDHALFLAIPLSVFMGTAHSESRRSLTGASVRRFIDRFNAISVWVTASVLSGRSPDNRAIIYEHIVQVASHFEEMNNFSALTACLSGLKQGSITRLSQSLNLVSAETKKRFLELSNLMAGEKNYSNYRAELASRELALRDRGEEFACVPHLATHIAQLSSIDESNIDHVSDAPHLINLSKHFLKAKSIEMLAQLQQTRYSNILPIRTLAAAFDIHLNQYVLFTAAENKYSAQKLYELSLRREEEQHYQDGFDIDEDNDFYDDDNFATAATNE